MTDRRLRGGRALPQDHEPTTASSAAPSDADPAVVFLQAMRGRHALQVVPGLHLDESSAQVDPDGVTVDVGLTGHPYTAVTMRWSANTRTTTADIELPTQGPFTLSNRDIGILWDTAPVTAAMIRSAVTNAATQVWTPEHADPERGRRRRTVTRAPTQTRWRSASPATARLLGRRLPYPEATYRDESLPRTQLR
ncbi:hypothetical protein [Leekyejoonella antrihumi]|uniref:Uncharacterized protein n=1 Tax=Leekyejoonella antrihumi TaxID=1660198 RepID=A0A563DWH7_9MICO|nr:hypothetical protein [Leekyejoonella antrihumi]TWP34479.1 hypothetical protein FGL98_17345 [Leekyejoonella antrihumi]